MATRIEIEQALLEPMIQKWHKDLGYYFVPENKEAPWKNQEPEPAIFLESSIRFTTTEFTDFAGAFDAALEKEGILTLRLKVPIDSGNQKISDLADMLEREYEQAFIHQDVDITNVVASNLGQIDGKFALDIVILFRWDTQ